MTDNPQTRAGDSDGENGLPPRPWERRPGESAPAFAAFCCYRDLGPRRALDEVDRQLYPPPAPNQRRSSAGRRRRGQISDWSRTHEWVTRVASWDAECDRQARLAQIEEVREMSRRHVQLARSLQTQAVEALRSLSPADMAATDILRYLIEATKLERLALGEPTDRTAQEVNSTPVVVEVVERLVPVRGDDRPIQSPPSVRVFEGVGVARSDNGVAGSDQCDPADFELPAEPPAFLRQ